MKVTMIVIDDNGYGNASNANDMLIMMMIMMMMMMTICTSSFGSFTISIHMPKL